MINVQAVEVSGRIVRENVDIASEFDGEVQVDGVARCGCVQAQEIGALQLGEELDGVRASVYSLNAIVVLFQQEDDTIGRDSRCYGIVNQSGASARTGTNLEDELVRSIVVGSDPSAEPSASRSCCPTD